MQALLKENCICKQSCWALRRRGIKDKETPNDWSPDWQGVSLTLWPSNQNVGKRVAGTILAVVILANKTLSMEEISSFDLGRVFSNFLVKGQICEADHFVFNVNLNFTWKDRLAVGIAGQDHSHCCWVHGGWWVVERGSLVPRKGGFPVFPAGMRS